MKTKIIEDPRLVGLKPGLEGKFEHGLWCGDRLDVYFPHEDVAVEVKTHEAAFDELHRGLFQCVKYKAQLRAQKIHDRLVPQSLAVLAIGGSLPAQLREIAELFEIPVFEGLQIDLQPRTGRPGGRPSAAPGGSSSD